jgi:hypothetical protein
MLLQLLSTAYEILFFTINRKVIKTFASLPPCLYVILCKNNALIFRTFFSYELVKGKAIPLQALTGPEGSRKLRFPDFKTIGTGRWQGCQLFAPVAFIRGNIPGTHSY